MKEDGMQITRFDKPVSILVGLGYPAKIHSAKQAYEFLSETPAISAKKAHYTSEFDADQSAGSSSG
jgi:hypothetical protein